ncbi:MAG: nucleotide-binding protein [Saprospiraceae bacterium]
MKIFLGSSTESIDAVRMVASWIEDNGFTPILWDSPSLFLPGDSTFPKLIEISRTHDAAIFIFGEDDKIWYRQDAITSQPRDNVLIEYGLFGGSLGQNKTIICRQGKAKIATDLNSIVFTDLTQVYKARLHINAWLNKLKTQPELDKELFQKKVEKEVMRRELENVKEQLDFEKAKSKELQEIISKDGKIDFLNYDILQDGHWKLLFDYGYFWDVVTAICKEYSTPNDLRTEIENSKLGINLSWENNESTTRTKIAVAKTLRWIRKYANNSAYKKLLATISKPELLEILNLIAEHRINVINSIENE